MSVSEKEIKSTGSIVPGENYKLCHNGYTFVFYGETKITSGDGTLVTSIEAIELLHHHFNLSLKESCKLVVNAISPDN